MKEIKAISEPQTPFPASISRNPVSIFAGIAQSWVVWEEGGGRFGVVGCGRNGEGKAGGREGDGKSDKYGKIIWGF